MAQKTHAEFMLLNPENIGRFSFQGYTDLDGELRVIHDRVDQNGIPQVRFFHWKSRILRVPLKQKEVVAHLRNSPFCEGNDITSSRIIYREIDPEKDADIKVSIELDKMEAKNLALSLTGPALANMAVLCGTNSDSGNIQRLRVLEYADANPARFMEIHKDTELSERALFRRAYASGVISKKGVTYIYKDIALGLDEDEAVKLIKKEPKVAESIQREAEPAQPGKKK
jgi:hypothetical protein